MAKLLDEVTSFIGNLVIKSKKQSNSPATQFESGKPWLDLQFSKDKLIVKLDELENRIDDPPGRINAEVINKIQGALFGLALGDALGTHVEFQSRENLLANPVKDLSKGGQWNLKKGQFTDNTSMALCLASSLIARHGFVPYDQLVRYKWWYQYGYMSSIGECFKLGQTTKDALNKFIRHQFEFAKRHKLPADELDYLSDRQLIEQFSVNCSKPGVAGSGALVRLAPVPLFFRQYLEEAVQLSGYSGQITHNDKKTYDACRYLGALLFAIVNGYTKPMLLDKYFYAKHRKWFGADLLCDEIRKVADGSYKKKGGYNDGIRGTGYVVNALEAALWAFWSDEDSFEKGVLAAVNLGDDTDTTAAIYGQLAGAYYGYQNLPKKWVDQVYAKKYLLKLSKWIAYEGQNWKETEVILPSAQSSTGGSSLLDCSERWGTIYKPSASPIPSRRMSVGSFASNYSTMSGPSTPLSNTASAANQHFDFYPLSYSNDRSNTKPIFDENLTANINRNSMKIIPSISLPDDIFEPISDETDSNHSDVETNSDRVDQTKSEPLAPKELDFTRCMDWSCQDVCNWIRSLGPAYETYIEHFQQQNINGDRLLNCIDEETLNEFHVNSPHHRQVIIYSITQLKNKYTPLTTPKHDHTNHFIDQFVGDFVPPLNNLIESVYPDTLSCTLKPSEDGTHAMLYEQIVQWLGSLPPSVAIDKIELVYNPGTYQSFLHQLNRTERKQTQEAFQPNLDLESNPNERKKVLEHLQTLIQQVKHNRNVSVVRVWHGCKREVVSSLISDGFAALGKLDNGWFGKAIYFTSSAEYAVKYTNSTGCLVMCYVILLNPFPVITDDAPLNFRSREFRFYGRGNYANYQCHYIPVAPALEGTLKNFRPPPNGIEDACYDEFAIFQQSDILPQVIVHLKPETVAISSPTPQSSDAQPLKPFLSKD